MRSKEVFEMSNEELNSKLVELKAELLGLRFAKATGQLENTASLSIAKKSIAKIKTVLRQRQIQAQE